MTATPHEQRSRAREILALWAGLLGAPVLWLIQFQFNYSLVTWGCRNQTLWPLHTASATFMLLSLGALLLAWHNWNKAGGKWPSEEGGRPGLVQFMGSVGVLVSAMFTVLIFAQAIPSFLLDPCTF
jgi:hypothetical protein